MIAWDGKILNNADVFHSVRTSELPQSRKVSAGVKIAPCVGKGRAN